MSNGFLRGNPVSLELGQRGADIDSLADTVTEAVVELYGPTDCESSMQAFVVSARRPALRDHRRRTPLTLVSSLDPGV